MNKPEQAAVNEDQSGLSDRSNLTAESLATKSIAELAALACVMPWEDKAPFSVRYEFQEAVTPELFVELLDALQEALEYIPARARPVLLRKAMDAIAKATAAVTNPIEADPK